MSHKVFFSVTWAHDPSVLLMSTVVLVLRSRTLPQVLLFARAVHVVQMDGSSAWREGAALSRHIEGVTTPELGAHHISIPQVPLVVTHCAPSPISPQLHSSSTAVCPPCQLHKVASWGTVLCCQPVVPIYKPFQAFPISAFALLHFLNYDHTWFWIHSKFTLFIIFPF